MTDTLSPTQTVTLGVTTDVGAVANLGSSALKFITELQADLNSPDEVKAAIAQKKLAAMDALALAQQQNDLNAERLAVESVGGA